MAISTELSLLIDIAAKQLPGTVIAHLRSLLRAGELGLCVEELCAALGEFHMPVSQSQFADIVRVGRALDVDPSW